MRITSICNAAVGGMLLAPAHSAAAHGIPGNRFFVGTLTFDDPSVADEAILPNFSTLSGPVEGGNATDDRFDWALLGHFEVENFGVGGAAAAKKRLISPRLSAWGSGRCVAIAQQPPSKRARLWLTQACATDNHRLSLNFVAVETLITDLQPNPEGFGRSQVLDCKAEGLSRCRETMVLGAAVFCRA